MTFGPLPSFVLTSEVTSISSNAERRLMEPARTEPFDRAALVQQLEAERAQSENAEAAPYFETALRRLEAEAPPAPAPLASVEALAALVDHTQLRPEATPEQIRTLCDEAVRYGFAAVCVNPRYVPLAAQELEGAAPRVCTVVGFPLGASQGRVKAFEAEQAVASGAHEVDMVVPIGLLRAGQYGEVEADIRSVVEAVGAQALVKVILENALLTDVQKALGCAAAQRGGADFVKTSTGFSTGGATAADVALMRRVVGAEMGVKAAGGVRSFEDARRVVACGATRIGASGAAAIMEGAGAEEAY